MNDTKLIADIFQEKSLSFIPHLKKSKHLEEESIHKLRVVIKNVRVLLSLISFFYEHKKNRALKKIMSPVFGAAGVLRSNSLNQKLIAKYPKNLKQEFGRHIDKKNKKAEIQFLKAIEHFKRKNYKSQIEHNKHLLKKFTLAVIKQKIHAFISIELQQIKEGANKSQSNATLHSIRKRLKNIKTIQSVLKKSNLLKPDPKIALLLSHYEKIGNWHDSVMFLKSLKKFLNKNKALKTKNNLLLVKKLSEQNNMNKTILFKTIKTALN